MKRTLLREVADHLNKHQETHLTMDELRSVVFEDPYSDTVASHLDECSMCSNLVEGEQERNPIYLLMKACEVDGLSKQEFWARMDQILKEITDEEEND